MCTSLNLTMFFCSFRYSKYSMVARLETRLETLDDPMHKLFLKQNNPHTLVSSLSTILPPKLTLIYINLFFLFFFCKSQKFWFYLIYFSVIKNRKLKTYLHSMTMFIKPTRAAHLFLKFETFILWLCDYETPTTATSLVSSHVTPHVNLFLHYALWNTCTKCSPPIVLYSYNAPYFSCPQLNLLSSVFRSPRDPPPLPSRPTVSLSYRISSRTKSPF